ncbi:DUF6510 family protein [Microbacterium sp. SLBN-146]|uniref:DUF6510 family protein n=1 Tax=Microbacterium sp. SLBN-146 TaxID=2768457 RepID=UPI0021B1C3E5|nr:DUF6510 family protein [Microbacterium sp. SLBN-146]
MSRVDGNAVAGLLAEIFVGDVTMLRGVCGECASVSTLAETDVELDAQAAIVRCRACTVTLFTVLRAGDGSRLVVGSLRELDGH